MKILERWSQKNLGDAVANEHLEKCVKVCLTDIPLTKPLWQEQDMHLVFPMLPQGLERENQTKMKNKE